MRLRKKKLNGFDLAAERYISLNVYCALAYIWSRSQEWTLIPEDERKKLGLNFSHDGEFW